jgi:hypothetical protein
LRLLLGPPRKFSQLGLGLCIALAPYVPMTFSTSAQFNPSA